jgi:hypothetical protein
MFLQHLPVDLVVAPTAVLLGLLNVQKYVASKAYPLSVGIKIILLAKLSYDHLAALLLKSKFFV